MNKLIEWVPEVDWFRYLCTPLGISLEEVLFYTGLKYEDFQNKYDWKTTSKYKHFPKVKHEVLYQFDKTVYNAELKRSETFQEYTVAYSDMGSQGARILLTAIINRHLGPLPENVELSVYTGFSSDRKFYPSQDGWSLYLDINKIVEKDLKGIQQDIEAGLKNQINCIREDLRTLSYEEALHKVQESEAYKLVFRAVTKRRQKIKL